MPWSSSTRYELHYRIAHWPVWIFAFFVAPGPVTFTLFAHGANTLVLSWLAVAMAGTAIAGFSGRLPGTEPTPYVLLYGEDTPKPVHRVRDTSGASSTAPSGA